MEHPVSSEDPASASRARIATDARGRAFLLRLVLSLAAFAAFDASGASARLLDGLNARFEAAWWPVHLAYLSLVTAALGILLLPMSLYEDFVVEARESGEETQFEDWIPGLLKTFAIDLVGGVAIFLLIHGLLVIFPHGWWLAASGVYALVAWGLSVIPMLQGPPADELDELRDPILRERLTELLARAGFPHYRLFRWTGESADEMPVLALLGVGRSRRVVVSSALMRDFTEEEIAALLAHEVSHPRHADTAWYNVLNAALALLAFGATDLLARGTAWLLDRPALDGLASYPILAGAVLLTSFLCLPALNAYSRHREYAADRFARTLAGDEPLRTALEKLGGSPTPSPAGPFDLLVHNQPDFSHRLHRLAQRGSP